jgi:hypothetical protein
MKISVKKSNYKYEENDIYILITVFKRTRKILLVNLSVWKEPIWYLSLSRGFLEGIVNGVIICCLINFLIYQPIIAIVIFLIILLLGRNNERSNCQRS